MDNNPLKSKLRRILDRNIQNDSNLLSALKFLSKDDGPTSFKTHRILRERIHELYLKNTENILGVYQHLESNIDELDQTVEEISDKWNSMNSELQATHLKTQDLVKKTKEMQEELEKVESQRFFASIANELFNISSADQELLRNEVMGNLKTTTKLENYLLALGRAKEVYLNLQLLIKESDGDNKKKALQTFEMIGLLIEGSYESMFKWALEQFRTQNREIVENSPIIIRKFIGEMYNRKNLFNLLLEEYTKARRMYVQQSFLDALTGSSSSKNNMRPIEIQSHDSLRYLGDMLAWLHQAFATEKEYLVNLTKECQHLVTDTLVEYLDQITEGLGHPFKLRASKMFTVETDQILLYKIHGLFVFYQTTIESTIGSKKQLKLKNNISEETEFAWRLFMKSLQNQTNLLSQEDASNNDPVTFVDLQPSSQVREIFRLISTILTIPSMARDDDKEEISAYTGRISQVLDFSLSTIFKYFENIRTQISLSDQSRKTHHALFYHINALHWIESSINILIDSNGINNCVKKLLSDWQNEKISKTISTVSNTLVQTQTCYILDSLGLINLYRLLAPARSTETPSGTPETRLLSHDVTVHGPLAQRTDLPQGIIVAEPHIRQLLANLDVFLMSPDKYDFDEWTKLSAGKLKASLRRQTAHYLHKAYSTIFAVITDPQNGYSLTQDDSIRTPDQVANLLMLK